MLDFPKWRIWLLQQFPNAKPTKIGSTLYQAFTVSGQCVVSAQLSWLDCLREAVKSDPTLPRPIVPVLARDGAMPANPPTSRWYLSEPDGFWLMEDEKKVKATPQNFPGYEPDASVIVEGCVDCEFGIYGCKTHLWGIKV